MTVRGDFWARRRAAVAAEAEAEEAARAAEARAEEHAQYEDKTDAEILAHLDLPDPDSLKMGDDFTAFMARAVPDHIRRRALRTLWRSNPVLANVDMLVDYGEDFTDSATVIENLQTAYQVGKGMLRHVEEMARQAEARAAPDAEPPAPEAQEPEAEDQDPAIALAQAGAPEHAEPETEIDTAENDDTHIPAPRRMKFTSTEHAA